jgi:hypothetical protein
MFRKLFSIAAIALAAISTPALADQNSLEFTARPTEGQTLRYHQGIPTIEDDLKYGSVRVVPIETLDHGSLQFMVLAYNKSGAPVNFGIENVSVINGGTQYACFTKNELEKKAKSRAMWSQIGYAMLAGAAAAAQDNNTYIRSHGSWGSSTTVISRPGLSGGQVATLGAGGVAIAASQIGLQRTLENLKDEILQTTTIDPENSYGGKAVVRKIKGRLPLTVGVQVEFAGEVRTFEFDVRS